MTLRTEAWDALLTLPIATIPDAFTADQGIVIARYSDRGWISRTTDSPANTLYEARLMGDVEISQTIIDALTVGNAISTTASELDLWNGDDALNDIAANGGMDGRPITIKISPVTARALSDFGGSLAAAVTIWEGIVSRVDALGLRARVAMNDFSERLQTLLISNTYDGLGGLGGIEELKGLRKPVSVGHRFNVRPVYVGLVDLGYGSLPTYQTHYRSIAGHDAVRIRGVAQSAVSSAPTIGQYVDIPSSGVFQLGSAADGDVTCDVRGDNVGTYKRSITDILRWMLTEAGPGLPVTDLDPQTWFDTSTEFSADYGWGHDTSPITTVSAINEVLQSIGGGFMFGTRAGKIAVGVVQAPNNTPRVELTIANIISCEPQPLPFSISPTPQAVQVGSMYNWHVQDDFAGSINPDEAARFSSPGALARAFSNTIAARSTNVREITIKGFYRYEADALARATEIRDWLERGLKMFEVETDRYLNSVELGMTVRITYPYYGLANGWSGIIVAWTEQIGARRLKMVVLG